MDPRDRCMQPLLTKGPDLNWDAMGLIWQGLMDLENGWRRVSFVLGDFNFCVRPKAERCILFKI